MLWYLSSGRPAVFDHGHAVGRVDLGIAGDEAVTLVEGARAHVLRQRVEDEAVRHQLLRPREQPLTDALTLAGGRDEDLGQLATAEVGGGEADHRAVIDGDHDAL